MKIMAEEKEREKRFKNNLKKKQKNTRKQCL